MTPGQRVAAAAESMLGAPFRLYGRNPEFGLDCVGLVVLSLERAGMRAKSPVGYRLHNSAIERELSVIEHSDLVSAVPPVEPGDIVLAAPGPGQHHLLLGGRDGRFIHAHAGLRRVVAMPGPLPWPVSRLWRPQSRG